MLALSPSVMSKADERISRRKAAKRLESASMTLLSVHDIVVFLVVARSDLLDPFLIFEIPFDRLDNTVGKLRLRIPSQFGLNLCRIDGVTRVMTETVSDMLDERVVDLTDIKVAVGILDLLLQHLAQVLVGSHHVVNCLDGKLHNVDVLHLVVPSDIINLTGSALTHNQIYGFAVVFDVKPVTHIESLTIDGQFLAVQNIIDDQRNELLGEMVRTIVVGASCDAHRHVISVAVSLYEEVGTRLAG